MLIARTLRIVNLTLRFRVKGSGFRIRVWFQSLGLRVRGLGLMVEGWRFIIWGSSFMVYGLGVRF
jgi:hypothetical protein